MTAVDRPREPAGSPVMVAYRLPQWPPPERSGPAAGSDSLSGTPADPERWLCGLAASYERWPLALYTFRMPLVGLPLYLSHEEELVDASGVIPGAVGVARRFAEIDDLGIICLIEISADYPSILWDLAAGRRTGLSIGAALDEPPDGGPTWIYLNEVSLTDRPKDPQARVISSGLLALHDWEVLTGEVVPAGGKAA